MQFCEPCYLWFLPEAWNDHCVKVLLATHLRIDHGMSRRKTARALGIRERFVRDHVDAPSNEEGK